MKNYILKMFISDKTTNFVVSIRFSTFMPQKKVYNIDHMFCFLVLESLSVQSSTKLAVVLWVRGNKLSRPLSQSAFKLYTWAVYTILTETISWMVGWEPWSCGYGRRLMFQRSWVRIPALYTGWTFFTYIFVVKFVMCLKRRKKWKRGRGWLI